MMMRIKEICDYVSRGSTPDYIDESPYKVMNQASFSKGYIDESKQRFTSKISQGANIRKGDLLMASTGGGVLGKVFYFDSDDESFYADSHVTIMRDSRGRNLMKYLYYAFSLKYDEINATLVKGSTNQTELQRNYLLAYELEMPSTIEQQRIVDYLDEKTKAIDARISVLEKKSDAYTRLKASVINRAVTRGLTPNVPLKDSGVEWIGMIPEHWEVKRVKDNFSIKRGRVIPATELVDDGLYPVYSSQTENSGCMGFINTYDFDQKCLTWTTDGVNAGTVFLREGKFNCTNICGILVPIIKNIHLPFHYYSLYQTCKHNKRLDTNGAKIMSNEMAVIKYPIPPLSEQQSIASYLDTKCSEIDKAKDNKMKS